MSATRPACPTCRQPAELPVENPSFPFCSPRCRSVDLGRWLTEGYRIPGRPAEPEELEGLRPPPAEEDG